ncbi:hypothetical protein JTB14_018050 [Gonioctena quinquepunctata]|nr:hypothetical protein JTB14_018050 [Gonioctena quinquepunctata]
MGQAGGIAILLHHRSKKQDAFKLKMSTPLHCQASARDLVAVKIRVVDDTKVTTRCHSRLRLLPIERITLHERGSVPTYFTPLVQTIVDLVMFSGTDRTPVKETLDHRHILFSLAGSSYAENSRNPRATRCDLKEELEEGLGPCPRYGSEAEIGTFAKCLQFLHIYHHTSLGKKVEKTGRTPWCRLTNRVPPARESANFSI